MKILVKALGLKRKGLIPSIPCSRLVCVLYTLLCPAVCVFHKFTFGGHAETRQRPSGEYYTVHTSATHKELPDPLLPAAHVLQ